MRSCTVTQREWCVNIWIHHELVWKIHEFCDYVSDFSIRWQETFFIQDYFVNNIVWNWVFKIIFSVGKRHQIFCITSRALGSNKNLNVVSMHDANKERETTPEHQYKLEKGTNFQAKKEFAIYLRTIIQNNRKQNEKCQ